MADDYGDILDLFGADPDAARSQAAVLAAAMRRRRGAGDLATIVGGPFAAAGKQFGGDADQLQKQLFAAAQHRPQAVQQGLGAQRAQEEAEAWKHPTTPGLLRGAIQQFMPNMQIPEDTPVPVLRNIAPMAEKFGGSILGATIRAGTPHGRRFSDVTDPNTGERYRLDAFDGSTYHINGQRRTGPVQGWGPAHAAAFGVSMPNDVSSGAMPSSAPAPAVPTPAPGGVSAPRPAMPGGGGIFPRMMGKPLDAALQKLGKDFDPNAAGSPEVVKNQARVNAANRILALAVDEKGQPRDLIPQQMTELSQSVATLLSTGGQPSERITRELTPYTSGRKWADVVQWLTNDPHGAGQREFVRLMVETAKREQATAQKGITDALGARVGKHQRVIRGNPAEAKAVLEPLGFSLDEKGNLAPKATGTTTAVAPNAQRAQGKDGKWYVNRGQGWEAE